MPLVHSKKPTAFVKNVKSEIHAGKPQKQALAIAYSVKRKAEHKADGGEMYADGGSVDPTQRPLSATNSSIAQGIANAGKHAEGGKIESSEPSEDMDMSDMAADELCSALESKDKSRIVSSIKALISSCMNDEDSND